MKTNKKKIRTRHIDKQVRKQENGNRRILKMGVGRWEKSKRTEGQEEREVKRKEMRTRK